MHDHPEVTACYLAYHQFRHQHPSASHEEGLHYAVQAWQDFLQDARKSFLEDEPPRLIDFEDGQSMSHLLEAHKRGA